MVYRLSLNRSHEVRNRLHPFFRPLATLLRTPEYHVWTGDGDPQGTAVTHEQLEILIRTHQAMVYRYLRYMGAAADVAEDVAQETFFAAYRSGKVPMEDMHAGGGRCAAWLRGVARNQLLMHFRKARSTPHATDPQVIAHVLEQAEEVWAAEFLRGGDGFDYTEALRTCLAKLHGTQKQVLDMFYREELSRLQIAEALKMSEDGIKSILRRVRGALKQCVEIRLRQAGAIANPEGAA